MGLSSFLTRAAKRLSRQNLYPYLKSALDAAPEGAWVLNVGAGGDVMAVIGPIVQRRRLKLVSTDIDASRKPDLVDDITRSALATQSFDLVVMFEVLEHVREPQAAVNEIRRVLKPGGAAVLSTPFIYPLHEVPHDYFRYTKYGLRYMFRDFAAFDLKERNSWSEAFLVLIARLGSLGGMRGKLLALIAVPLAFLLWPLARVASATVPSDFLTTGYLMTAQVSAMAADEELAREPANDRVEAAMVQ